MIGALRPRSSRLRSLVLSLVLLASLLACCSARAATVTVGSPQTAGFASAAFGAPGMLAINSELGEAGAHVTSPVDGAVIGWQILGEGGPFRLRLVRPEGAGTFLAGAASAPQTIAAYGPGNFITDLPIEAGEMVGIQATHSTDRIGTAVGTAPGSAVAEWVTPPESSATGAEGGAPDSEMSFSATVLPAPTIVSITPTSGPLAGGTSVTVSGTDFTDLQGVSFGSVPAAVYSVTSEGQLTAVAPAGTSAGAVPISVTTEAGTASSTQSFTYAPPPVAAPVEGPWSGVTSIGLPVHFLVKGGNVIDAHFGFHWGYCGNFSSHDQNTDPIDPEGHWSFDAPEGQTIEGSFVAPDRVEGTVTAVSRMTPGCPATKATFVAVPGKVPPPTPLQYYATTNSITGSQLRLPEMIYLGRFVSFFLFHMHWSDWGRSVAFGTGQASIRQFKREWNPKARVKLSRPIADGPNRRLYSLLRFSLQGRLPAHYPRTGWFKFKPNGVVSSSDGRWPGGPGYTGKHHRAGSTRHSADRPRRFTG